MTNEDKDVARQASHPVDASQELMGRSVIKHRVSIEAVGDMLRVEATVDRANVEALVKALRIMAEDEIGAVETRAHPTAPNSEGEG